MATYKVIQNIEAEDKLLGPLTLRQFIYAAIAAVCLYLCFLSIAKHAVFLILVFLPIAIVCGFFAFPFVRDQPTEIWALAKIRFLLKPHKRVWNQSGVKELVTITAPKKIAEISGESLSISEVQSRLKALASTLDTRGWATKNMNVNLSNMPLEVPRNTVSDRLVNTSSLPQTVPDFDIQLSDDILDEKNNRTASNFDQMITVSTQQHRKQVVDTVNRAVSGKPPIAQPVDDWFLNQTTTALSQTLPKGYKSSDPSAVSTGTSDNTSQSPLYGPIDEAEERALVAELRARRDISNDTYNQHLKVIEPLSSKKKGKKTSTKSSQTAAPPRVTPSPDPAILALASNNDLNVATIARQAKQVSKPESPENEVVINLH